MAHTSGLIYLALKAVLVRAPYLQGSCGVSILLNLVIVVRIRDAKDISRNLNEHHQSSNTLAHLLKTIFHQDFLLQLTVLRLSI